jgi:hypothetical protein
MDIAEVQQHLPPHTTARSPATATEKTFIATSTDPVDMATSVVPPDLTISGSTCHMRTAAVPSTAVSRNIVDPASMERIGIGQRSAAIGMMKIVVMNAGMTDDTISIALAIVTIAGMTDEMTVAIVVVVMIDEMIAVMTVEMTVEMIVAMTAGMTAEEMNVAGMIAEMTVVRTVDLIDIVTTVSVSARESKTRTL